MSLQTYTLEEIKLHKKVKGKEKDAWVVLHDKVYDISKFVDEVHPGGHEILGDHVGKDASGAFNDQGHSSDARLILKQHLIGKLDEKDCTGVSDEGPKSWGDLKVRNTKNVKTKFNFGIFGILLIIAVILTNYFNLFTNWR